MYLFEILRTLKITLFKIIETNKIMSCSQLLYFDKMKTSYSQRLCYQHLLGQSFPNAIHFVDFCFNKKTQTNVWKQQILISFCILNCYVLQQLQYFKCDMNNWNFKCFHCGCSKYCFSGFLFDFNTSILQNWFCLFCLQMIVSIISKHLQLNKK